MIGEQKRGRAHVLDSPTVWSECMWVRKKSRAEPARRRLQKSTAMGVCGITTPFMAAGSRSAAGSSWEQSLPQRPREEPRRGKRGARDPEGSGRPGRGVSYPRGPEEKGSDRAPGRPRVASRLAGAARRRAIPAPTRAREPAGDRRGASAQSARGGRRQAR